MTDRLRIIHRADDAPDGLIAEVRELREVAGVAQAELYRTLATAERDHAVAILLESEEHLAAYLARLEESPLLKGLVEEGHTEVYRQQRYQLENGKWVPENPGVPLIMWPASGAVSIVIQNACEPNPEMRSLSAQEIEDTRREPGCEYYAWFENVELENHLMLLEVWKDQAIYDAHWFGRMATADYRGNSGRIATTPQRDHSSREFYRLQQFSLHYGRLLPAQISHYSHTVDWTAR